MPTSDQRTRSNDQTNRAGPGADLSRPLAAGALLLFGLAALISLGGSAAASDDACPLGAYEVNASVSADDPPNCLWDSLQDVFGLPTIVPSDRILVRNGTYNISWNLTTSDLTIVGDSPGGAVLDGQSTGPALRIQASNTVIWNLAFRTSSGTALVADAGTSGTSLVQVSVTGAGTNATGADIRGDTVDIRDLTVSAARGASMQGSHFTVIGLNVTTTTAGAPSKLSLNVSVGSFTGVNLTGSFSAAGLNITLGCDALTFTDLSTTNAAYGVLEDTNGTTAFYNISLTNFTTVGFYQRGGLASSARADRANIIGTGTYGVFIADGDLLLSNSTLRNAPTGILHAGNRLTLLNVTLDNHASYGLYKNNDGVLIAWDGGSVSRTPYGFAAAVPLAGTQFDHKLANVSFSNITTYAILLSSSTTLTWTGITVVDCDFRDLGAGVNAPAASARPGTAFTIARNRFTNLTGVGVGGTFTGLVMDGNAFQSVRSGVQIELSGADLIQNYNSVSTSNTIDSRPMYYLLNVSDFTVPADASQVWIINSTNITVSGLAQTSAYIGVNGVLSRSVSVVDSSLMGNGSAGVLFRNSTQLTLRNLTITNSPANAVYLENVTGATVDGIDARIFAYLLHVAFSQRIAVSNLTDGGLGSGTLVWVRGSAVVTVDGINGGFVRTASTAIQVEGSNNIAVRNVTLTGGLRGLFATNSQDLLFQDLLFNNTRLGFDIANSARVLIERTNVSSNLTAYSIFQSTFVTIRGAYASSNTNPITFGTSPDGRLEDALVAGRTPVRGVFVDNSDRFAATNVTVVVPSNVVAFHLGTLTGATLNDLDLSALSPWIAGGRGLELNQVSATVTDLRIDGFDNGIVVVFSAITATRVVQTNASQFGFNAQNTGAIAIRDSSFASIVGPAIYLLNPSFLAAPSLYHSSFVSDRSWGGRFANADGLSCIDCNFTSLIGLAAVYLESSTLNANFVHSNFYGSGIDNIGSPGIWDGGYPFGGNFYSWAAPAFLDELTSPSQTTPGYDGLADFPYAVGGGNASVDRYPLMDPWPPTVTLTSPPAGSLVRGGTLVNFSVSNFFSTVSWVTSLGPVGGMSYPHDIATAGWADGPMTVTVTASDPWAPTVQVRVDFTFDSTAPTVTALPELGTAIVGRGALINLSATDAHPGTLYAWIDGALLSGSSISVPTAGLADGTHTLMVEAVDAAGNMFSYLWTFTVDGTPPVITAVDEGSPIFVQPGFVLHYSVEDASGIAVATYTAVPVGGGSALNGILASGGATRGLSTSGWPDGCFDVTVTAVDSVGFEAASARTVCVDGTAPDLSGMDDPYFVDEDAPFTMPGAAATDLDDELVFSWSVGVSGGSVTLDGASSVFVFVNPGNFTVIATVRDRLANIAVRSFTVIVADLTPPTAAFDAPTEWKEDVALSFNGSTSTDNSGAPLTYFWSSDGPSGFDTASGMVPSLTFATPGLHTVTLRVTDRGGHNASLARQLLIKDTTAPTLVVTGALSSVNQGALLRLDASSSTDNDPLSVIAVVWRFTQSGSAVERVGTTLDFTFDTAGNYSIEVTATDASGNSATKTVDVHVNAAPRITRGPVGSAVEGVRSVWDLDWSDADAGDHVTLRLVSGEPGMEIRNGELIWTPPLGSAGVYTVVIEATDGSASANYTYDILVDSGSGVVTPTGDSTGLWILLLLAAAGGALVLGRRMGSRRHDEPEGAPPRSLSPTVAQRSPMAPDSRFDQRAAEPVEAEFVPDIGEGAGFLTGVNAHAEAEAAEAEAREKGGRRGQRGAPGAQSPRASLRGESSEGELETDRE